ncbi:Lrp/AsnC family transcriptional regulator [Sphingomonas sp. RB3P16]|uniref:Lrp/AsnC family transcriptional regulator n=1 Tax=Parasphingomonas frigoris TaxID=3096163 RepID=UPI002FC6EE3C
MDKIDRAILSALQANGALSHAELASRVGASTASCWRRIKALEASGVLLGTVRLVDAAKVGCGVNVMCHVRLRSHARDDRAGFEDFVGTRGEILECYSMSGEWDYLLRIVAADIAGYDRFLMRTLLEHPCVATASSHFAMSQTKYTTALPLE